MAGRFTPWNRDEKHPSEDQQLELNKLQSPSRWSDLKLPSPKKHTQRCSQNRKDSCQKDSEGKGDAWLDKRDQMKESDHAVDAYQRSVISYKEYKTQKEVEQQPSAMDKPTLGEEED